MRRSLTGTRLLVAVGLRRERWTLLGWIVALAGITTISASATIPLYPTVSAREAASAMLNSSAATVALFGRIVDPGSVGALALLKMGSFGSIFVAMLAVLLVVRHTRGDEDARRAELLGAAGAARLAPVASAFSLVAIAMGLLAAATVVGLVVVGLGPSGAVAFALGWVLLGTTFAAIAALLAQAAPSARAANGLAAAVVGACYLLRAVADAGPSFARWLTWVTPFGWELAVRAYQGDRYWALLVPAAATVLLGSLALVVASRRDLGAGLVEERPGPASASARLAGVGGLAWRLQRISLASWAGSFLLYGLLLGSLVTSADRFLTTPSSRELIERLGGQKVLVDAFLSAELSIAALLASGFAMASLLRLRSEEDEGHAALVLATATSRRRLAASHLSIAALGGALLMVLFGLGAGLAYAIASHDLGHVGPVVVGSLVQVPAILVMVGLTALLIGVAPRATAASWVALATFVALGEVGPILKLSHWLMDLSPFGQVPHLPGGELTWLPLIGLGLLAGALLAVGDLGYRRRDIG